MNHPVVIVGAGPTGLMLAGELGLAGIETVVLERLDGPRTGSWGIGLHARTVDALRLRGLADKLDTDSAIVWPRIHFGLFWLDLTPMLDHEYTLMVPQQRTEQVLAERAVELGAEIRYGHDVVGISQDDDGVTVDVRTPDGEQRIQCQYLIGCDGGNGVVSELAGFTFDTLGNDETYYGVLGDALVPPGFHDHFRAGIYPDGLFAAIPLPSGETRLMSVEFAGKTPGPDEPATAAELATSIQRVTGNDGPIGETSWVGRCGNPTRVAEQYRKGRVLLAGDAAHAHLPAATHGLNTGVQDALNLGWKLAGQLRGWAPAGLLDSYHAERHPVGRRACVNSLAQQALMHPIDEVGPLRELFGELLGYPEVNRYLVEMVTTVRYPMGHPGEDQHPLAGRPITDAPLETSVITPALHNGRAAILGPIDHTADISGWADRVTVHTGEGIPDITILVRPDGVTAWAGTDHKGLTDALTFWFGEPAADSR
jgi:2-polyprenyl-6-methoxyphenol hydroxylase-like FAD-dependent oxidoreductase